MKQADDRLSEEITVVERDMQQTPHSGRTAEDKQQFSENRKELMELMSQRRVLRSKFRTKKKTLELLDDILEAVDDDDNH